MIITREGIITRQGIVRARQLQESMRSAPLPPPGLTAAAYFRPAQSVGGDLYELVELPDGRLLLAIADVCGHGTPAALLAVVVQEGIRRFAQPDPIAVLAGVNQLLLEKAPQDMFVTAACVVIDPYDGSVVAAVAGHPPPLYWDHAQGRLVVVREHGPTLGLAPDWGGPTARWRLAPRDTLVLYTDGVLDAKLSQEERLGEVRLAELLGRSAPASAAEWVDRLQRTLEGCVERPDDVTVVAIGREPRSFQPKVDGRTAEDAVWAHEAPFPASAFITGW
jgi:sigma-B regulation protein RsbU (phosphoserine phosphatase)